MKYFGTDGFRGRANEGLNVDHAFKIGRFVGWYYGARRGKARVIIGKDTPFELHVPVRVSGLVASGADAYMLHVIRPASTPMRSCRRRFRLRRHDRLTATTLTDNGIKLVVNHEGYKMDEDVLERSSRTTSTARARFRWPPARTSAAPWTMQGRNRYIASLIS